MDEKEGTKPFYQSTRHINGAFLSEPLEKLLKTFWECPIDVVREECLAGIARNAPGERSASWVEEHLAAIISDSHVYDGRPYWESLLSWYLFDTRNGSNSPLRTRALEFAIHLLFGGIKIARGTADLPVGCELWEKIAKIIAGVIRKYPELYWAPSVPEFLEASLAHYDNWTIQKRAIELICLAEDTSLWERIAEFSRRAKGVEKAGEDFKKRNIREWLEFREICGYLEGASHHLISCKTYQEEVTTSRFEKKVSNHITLFAGLTGSPIETEFRHPNLFENVPRSDYFSLGLLIRCAGGEKEVVKFRAALNALRLSVTAEGAEIYHSFPPEPGGFPSRHSSLSIFQPVSEHTEILFKPLSRKTIRVSLEISKWDESAGKEERGGWPGNGIWRPLAKITHYFYRAE